MIPTKARFAAAWVPGLQHDIDRDEGLAIGFRWLLQAEREYGGRGIVVMYAKRMVHNAAPLQIAARRWQFVSPRSQSPHGTGPVLAIWPPDGRTLELAEQLAFGTALCVIPGSLFDVSAWVQRTGAECLVEGFPTEESPSLPAEVKKSLDSILRFGGHNNFLGGGEKEITIRSLREIARKLRAPTRGAIETYLRASGETRSDGVERAGKWYSEILEGKRHRDYRGRIIH